MKKELLSDLLSAAVVALLAAVVYALMKAFGRPLGDPWLTAATGITLAMIVVVALRRQLRDALLDRLSAYWARRAGGAFGFVRFYPNFRHAENAIRDNFSRAKTSRILIQLGRNILGGHDKALLFDAARLKKRSDETIRVLCAGKNSDQFTRQRAKDLGSSYESWMAAVAYTLTNIQALVMEGIAIEVRCHREPYLWRLFFLDEVLFIVPYIVRKQNEEHAPVIECRKMSQGQPSIYALFETYFEDLWDRCQPYACVDQPASETQ
ncbi:MAG TPA: hypothetical protein VGS57_02065 [Thermoanaerobaculia bacterium]|jgi:hypothetical protein|nr:hypothetical protein [Thermoanaerobaculia bacterium]